MARIRKSSWTRGEFIALCSMLLSAVAVLKGCSLSSQIDTLKTKFNEIAPLKDKITNVVKSHANDIDIVDKSY